MYTTDYTVFSCSLQLLDQRGPEMEGREKIAQEIFNMKDEDDKRSGLEVIQLLL